MTKKTSAPIVEMLRKNAWFKPSIAVPIRVTVTTPITIPSVVRAERILFARSAAQEMRKPSFSSVPKFIPFDGNPKRQRTAALQNLSDLAGRVGVGQSSAALDCASSFDFRR